jgi:transposase-like protein
MIKDVLRIIENGYSGDFCRLPTCPRCGSINIIVRGFKGINQRYECNNCEFVSYR